MSDHCETPFRPMTWTLADIKRAIPSHCFKRDLGRGLFYLARDLLMALTAALLVYHSQRAVNYVASLPGDSGVHVAIAVRWVIWVSYWWVQSLIFMGLFVIGHECGHGAFSEHQAINDVIGFVIHTFLWTPYFSWKISHHGHHMGHGSIERDEVFIPRTRSELGIPPAATRSQLREVLGDSPLYTLFLLLRRQCLGFPAYFLLNASGQKRYPKWTNHFDPHAVLFAPSQRRSVVLSNMGLVFMLVVTWGCCSSYGAANILKYYGLPWIGMMHHFILITYLQHTAPDIPHYRGKGWTFPRGATSTVDRSIFGWQGDFFIHNLAHYHVIHHFFPKMPFYHGKEATRHLRALIGEHYHRYDGSTLQVLWDVSNRCQFVEDTGEILFYKDKYGRSVRQDVDLSRRQNPDGSRPVLSGSFGH